MTIVIVNGVVTDALWFRLLISTYNVCVQVFSSKIMCERHDV